MCGAYREAGIDLPPFERYDAEHFDGLRVLSGRLPGAACPRRCAAKRGAHRFADGLERRARDAGVGRRGDGLPALRSRRFPSLLRYVELAQPKRVLLNHGWKDFVHRLRRLGIDAEYLEANPQLALF